MSVRIKMAFMLVAKSGHLSALRDTLGTSRNALQGALSAGSPLRLGIRPDADTGDGAGRNFPVTDAAIETTVASTEVHELPAIASAWRKAVALDIDPQFCCAMAGECHEIIEPRPGEVFYSLTFMRNSEIDVADFRRWWLGRHGPLASELLRDDLLGYDQVHVDDQLSRRLCEAAGFDWPGYDAYDNLTWASLASYLKMADKADAMQALYQDELGHIDHSTYKGALLAEI
jgi:hypothetical protein